MQNSPTAGIVGGGGCAKKGNLCIFNNNMAREELEQEQGYGDGTRRRPATKYKAFLTHKCTRNERDEKFREGYKGILLKVGLIWSKRRAEKYTG